MQPMPTRSPTAKSSTSVPTSAIVPGDLVPGDQREGRAAEVVVAVMQIGVADAGKVDRDPYVAGAQVAPLDRGGLERVAGGGELQGGGGAQGERPSFGDGWEERTLKPAPLRPALRARR